MAGSWAPWGPRYYGWAVGSAAVLTVLLFVLLMLGERGLVSARIVGSLDMLVQVTALLFTLAACVSAAVTSHGRGRWGWTFLTGAFATTLVASAAWVGTGVPDLQSPTTAALLLATYVAALPAAVSGILFLHPISWRAGSLARALLDAAMVSAGVFFLAWALLLEDRFQASEGAPVVRLLTLAFPVFDVLLVTACATVASRVSPRERGTLLLILGGFVAFAVTDVAYGTLAVMGSYRIGHPIDAGYLVGMLLLGLAALRPLAWAAARPASAERLGLTSSLVPFASVVACLAVAALTLARDGFLDPALLWLGLGIVALVVVRQAIALIENDRMAARVERAAQFKSDLLRFVSHEASTPLTPMRIHMHMLARADPGSRDALIGRSLPVLERNLARLEGLVSEVLDLSHMDGGRFAVEPSRVDLGGLVGEAVAAYTPQFEQRGVGLVSEGVSIPLLADGKRIGQVLDNLLSNALKFSQKGGQVRVTAQRVGGHARIEVADTGVGMRPDQLAGLFTPFGRVHNGESVAPGNGLGLYLCRGIVEQHRGRIWAESDGPGLGSRFLFELPLDRGAAS